MATKKTVRVTPAEWEKKVTETETERAQDMMEVVYSLPVTWRGGGQAPPAEEEPGSSTTPARQLDVYGSQEEFGTF